MSRDFVFEDVPALRRRTGDAMQASANNSSLLLGRDRVGSVDSGYGSQASATGGRGAGAAHLIVGRVSEDPSFADDSATLYMSAKTDPDSMAGTGAIGATSTAVSGMSMRADCIRIVPRKDLKISVGSAYIHIDSSGNVTIEGNLRLGEGASQSIMLGEEWNKFWSTVTVPTPMGPSGPPPPIPASVFSKTNRAK